MGKALGTRVGVTAGRSASWSREPKTEQLAVGSGKSCKVDRCQTLRALESRVKSSGSILSGMESD